MTLSEEKSRLRHSTKAARAALTLEDRRQASQSLCDRLWPFLQNQGTKRIAIYLARSVEISLDPLIELLLSKGIEVSAPRLDLEQGRLTFHHLESLNSLQLGAWNVREPLGEEVVPPTLVLVPGLAFDERGHRLGMGGGWYDRTLTAEMAAIGVCFDCQIVPSVPVEDHDRTMNWVFSEAREFGPLAGC